MNGNRKFAAVTVAILMAAAIPAVSICAASTLTIDRDHSCCPEPFHAPAEHCAKAGCSVVNPGTQSNATLNESPELTPSAFGYAFELVAVHKHIDSFIPAVVIYDRCISDHQLLI